MKEVYFSRHARRRMELYAISETMVKKLLPREITRFGRHEIINQVEGFALPIKVVFEVKDSKITIITAYSVKRRKI